MTLYMLDTNICSYIIRKAPVSVLHRLNDAVIANNTLAISAITFSEMLYGTSGKKAPSGLRTQVDRFCERVDILSWDSEAVRHASDILAKLRAEGQVISMNDIAIAGHARSVGAILISNNLREFSRVEGLQTENWVD